MEAAMKKTYISINRRQIILFLLCAVIIVVAFCTAMDGAAGSAETSVSKKLPIYSVGRDENDKIISISFDAAWGNEDTQILIDILEKYNIKATFFLVGEWVDKYPESVKALSDAGHEIMNHSDTHPHMSQLSAEEMAWEIDSCNDKIEKITGVRPMLFRAPYGEYNNTLIEVLEKKGMYCIQWDVDSLDWKDPAPADISSRVCRLAQPGSICLFHNAAKNTPEALPILLEQLLADGYTFVPISQAIYRNNYRIAHDGRQWPVSASDASAS